MTVKFPTVPVILYFFAESIPTPEERIEVSQLRGRVQHRTAAFVGTEDKPEECDGVAGTVPAIYKKKPSAEAAMKAYDAAVKALAAKTGDKEAPKAPASDGKPAGTWPGSQPAK